MGLRRDAREAALQFLYQHDSLPAENLDRALVLFWQQTTEPKSVQEFAQALIRGVLAHRPEVDKKIAALADNWDLDRLALIDRNVLRISIYEMLHCPDVPPVVSINEAIEIAKKFSTAESGKFVNGLLDQVKQDLLRPARQAAGGNPTKS